MTNPSKESIIRLVAVTCHEINRALSERIDALPQPAWKDAPSWQHEDTIESVRAIAEGHVERPEHLHINWMERRRKKGWTYGKTKDPGPKKHPCMVPFDELSLPQRLEYVLCFATCQFLLPHYGVEVAEPEAPKSIFDDIFGEGGSELVRAAINGIAVHLAQRHIDTLADRRKDKKK